MANHLDPLDVTRPPGSNPYASPITLDLDHFNQDNAKTTSNGVQQTHNSDGSITFDFDPKTPEPDDKNDFYRNLADDIDEGELQRIATEILEGVEIDIQSRKEWLETRARGVELLGFKLEIPTGEVVADGGVSKVRHPILADMVLRFQANARGELLPAGGPVKVRNDNTLGPKLPVPQAPPQTPPPGPPPQIGHNGGPPMGNPMQGPSAGSPVGAGGPGAPPPGPPPGPPSLA